MGTKRHDERGERVYSITSARRALSEDLHDRTIRYLVSMGIRTLFFVLAVVTPSPWRWIFAVGAIVIPYIAVTIANAGREAEKDTESWEPGTGGHREVQLYDPRREFLR